MARALRHSLLLALALAVVACGDPPTSTPSTTASPGATPPGAGPVEAPVAATAATSPPVRPGRPRAHLSDEDRTRLRDAIAAGRTLSRSGDHAGALARFSQALALDPTSARLHCEAGFVAFRAGELDLADNLIRFALTALPSDASLRDELRVPTAMCLYNAGLVHEACGRTSDARAAFTRSLALRPNDTVGARLAALDLAADPLGVEGAPTFSPTATFEEIARRLRDDFCHRGAAGFGPGDLESCDVVDIAVHVAAQGAVPSAITAAVIGGDFTVPAGGQQIFQALAVRAGGVLLVAELGEGYSPGVEGMSVLVEVEASYLDALPGGAPELVVALRAEESDSDMGYCDYSYGGEAVTILCSTDSGALACASFTSAAYSVSEHEACDDVWETSPDANAEPDVATREAFGYRALVRFEDGRVLLDAQPDFPEGPPSVPLLRDLLRESDAAWPAAWTPLNPASG